MSSYQALAETANHTEQLAWRTACLTQDLVVNSGVCVLMHQDTVSEIQIALFLLENDQIFAIENHDPIGKANVLYRGIVGSINESIVVASPLYKQHFDLKTGVCVEDESISVSTFDARIKDETVELFC